MHCLLFIGAVVLFGGFTLLGGFKAAVQPKALLLYCLEMRSLVANLADGVSQAVSDDGDARCRY